MAEHEFVRNDGSHALINSDTSALDIYRMKRLKAKRQKSLEFRVEELERRLEQCLNEIEILRKERE